MMTTAVSDWLHDQSRADKLACQDLFSCQAQMEVDVVPMLVWLAVCVLCLVRDVTVYACNLSYGSTLPSLPAI
jgi:hypothetical protein